MRQRSTAPERPRTFGLVSPGLTGGDANRREAGEGEAGRADALCMLICMQSTSVRIDPETHEELKRLAKDLGTTVGRTVTRAVRALRQDRIGSQLARPLRDDETAWLDADVG